jgi:hypothetical protein
MAFDLTEFYQEFFQDLHHSADADGRYVEDAFFELFCSHLVEAGELETADHAQYLSPRGIRIDGYGGDPRTSGGVLNLIIADFNPAQDVETLTATDMNAIFNRANNFLRRALDATFRDRLEETSPAFGLADLIAARWTETNKVRILLISNRALSERVDGREAEEVEGVPVTYGVWDMGRLHRYVSAGHGREDIEIDLQRDFGGCLPALPAHLDGAGYEAYLAVIPGAQLAEIYDRWGAQLLEQNVRVFLQARNKVNKGIRITLENDAEMFFAYNNGITATAEHVETRQTHEGLLISGLRNLQIVNGGQTTASIHAASRKKENDLSRVFVQMKLSVVEPAKAIEVVPKISEFANTQNKVNAADFFANHPFHVRMESFSRRIFAPSPDGTFRESKWFYERARGQYQDARAHLTAAQRRKFDLEYPKRQMFTKTDFAKFLMLWRCCPDTVSKGAQKNFAEFAQFIGQEWAKNADVFNELYYRHAIAKAIVFRRVEALVSNQSWYEGGYRANIVAYAIAKMAHDVEERVRAVDFEQIWREQDIPQPMEDALVEVAQVVHSILISPPVGTRNVTEWAKQRTCWLRVKETNIQWPSHWLQSLISAGEQKQSQRSAVREQRVLNGIEAQTAVLNAGGAFWRDVRNWGATKKLLSPTELGVLELASEVPSRIPSEKQCAVALNALTRLQGDGCQLSLEG